MRECVLFEVFVPLDMVLANDPKHFRRKGLGVIGNLIYVSAALARRVAYQVSEDYTYSDHQATSRSSKKSSPRTLGGLPGWTTPPLRLTIHILLEQRNRNLVSYMFRARRLREIFGRTGDNLVPGVD